MIEKKPFVNYRTNAEVRKDEKPDIFSIRLSPEDRRELDLAKQILKQPKDSTALKQLSALGLIVLQDGITGKIISQVLNNTRRNERTGINDFS